jgi:DNA-binding response OmpR family regulator
MISILVVEDEPSLRADLVDYLTMKGLHARGVGNGAAFRQAVTIEPPQIIILDLGLPDADGLELAEEIRRTGDFGIIMLTALAEPKDRIRGFEAGADIYLMKQATLREIDAAVASLWRRLSRETDRSIAGTSHNWVLHYDNWSLCDPDGVSISLTATEFAFLEELINSAGKPVSREELIKRIGRPIPNWNTRHLDSIISRLRRKTENATGKPLPLKMIYGEGYVFLSSRDNS